METLINVLIVVLLGVWAVSFIRYFSSSEEKQGKHLRNNERRDTTSEEW